MLKEPVAGRVKTRLGRDIGMTTATWWFRHQTADLIRRMARDPRWETMIAVAPVSAVKSRAWPADIRRIPQGMGGLGMRMTRIFNRAPPGPVLIVGGDIPGIDPRHIQAAFKKLGKNDLVIGPATDGGFWLVGVKHLAPKTLFNNVRWSSKHTLQDTLQSAGPARVGFVKTLQDVDTINDLRQL